MANQEFDLFIAYSSANTQPAKTIMEDLEERFKIKCCFADRDFLPGTEIAVNISFAIEKSDKVLMLISPDFVESGWCWFEQQEAFRKYALDKRHCIIPVMLETVDEMPKLLRNITYVDFQKEDDPVERIYKACIHHTVQEEACQDEKKENSGLCVPNWGVSRHFYDYDDDFVEAKERIEFLEEETDLKILQKYFDDAAEKNDFDLFQSILENKDMKLNPNNVFKVCVHVAGNRLTHELIDTIFQNIDKGFSYRHFKNAYLVACSKGPPYLVSKFDELGCKNLIDASFVESLIPGSLFCATEKNEVIDSILNETGWSDQDLLSFLQTAIQSRKPAIIKDLLNLISKIPFQIFSLLIFVSDEQTCIEVLHRENYRGQADLQVALLRSCMMKMTALTREILKQGIILEPNIFNKMDFSVEEVGIFIEEYPWSLEELMEINNLLTKPQFKRLVKSEIQKKTLSSRNTTLLYQR